MTYDARLNKLLLGKYLEKVPQNLSYCNRYEAFLLHPVETKAECKEKRVSIPAGQNCSS